MGLIFVFTKLDNKKGKLKQKGKNGIEITSNVAKNLHISPADCNFVAVINEERRKNWARDTLAAYIATHGMRATRERNAILSKLMEFSKPFSVDELHGKFRDGAFTISKATAYNAVRLFAEAGIIRKVAAAEDKCEQYVVADDNSPTIRLICTQCGRSRKVRDTLVTRIISEKKFPSFVQSGFELYVHGLCASCRKKLKNNTIN